ncbi:GAF domain-containing protein [Streptomyces sp. NPDC048441]|uniref:helix-turn-helix domain-containing protein n=1 Tax=Streptomyces sp. NPDC048441 TaxID=3365552 RepID=UPI003714A0FB
MSRPRRAADALTVLELLAVEAPEERFEALLEGTRRDGAGGPALERLEEAKRLGITVHSQRARLRRRETGSSALVDAALDLIAPVDLDALMQTITRRARLLLSLDMSFIGTPDGDPSILHIHASDGHTSVLNVGLTLTAAGGIGHAVLEASAPFWTPDYLADERFVHNTFADEVVELEGLRAMMVLPLAHGSERFGALYVADRHVRHFTADEVSLLSRFCELAAAAIHRARLLEQDRAALIENGRATARRIGSLHARLLATALDDSGPQATAHEMAEQLGGAIRMESPSGTALAAAGGVIPQGERAELARGTMRAHAARGPVPLGRGLWAAPVVAGSEDLGTLTLYTKRPQSHQDEQLLSVGALAMAAALLLDNTRAVLAEGQIRDELLDDLLAHPPGPLPRLETRARRLGLDLDQAHIVVVARPEHPTQNKPLPWAASYALRLGGLKCWRDGTIVLLLPGTDASAVARSVFAELTPLLDGPVTVGASGPSTNPATLYDSYREARRCLDAMTALGAVGQASSLRELGFVGMLLSDDHDVNGFIAEAIGPVLEYDRQRLTELIRTLEAYFEAGASQIKAAKLLHVHPNTVARRLERVGKLLGPAWQQQSKALEIQLALRLSHVAELRHSPPAQE